MRRSQSISQCLAGKFSTRKLKLKFWMMSDLGFSTPGYAFITNETFAKKKPDVVKAFVQATLKGQQYAIDHTNEALNILVAAVPELRRDEEAIKWKTAVTTTFSDATKKAGIGVIDVPKWQKLNNLLVQHKAHRRSGGSDGHVEGRLPQIIRAGEQVHKAHCIEMDGAATLLPPN